MTDFEPAGFVPSLHKPSSLLPIARRHQSLLYLIETFPVTIVVGQTGSGKTTQIPQFLERAGVSDVHFLLSGFQDDGENRIPLVQGNRSFRGYIYRYFSQTLLEY